MSYSSTQTPTSLGRSQRATIRVGRGFPAGIGFRTIRIHKQIADSFESGGSNSVDVSARQGRGPAETPPGAEDGGFRRRAAEQIPRRQRLTVVSGVDTGEGHGRTVPGPVLHLRAMIEVQLDRDIRESGLSGGLSVMVVSRISATIQAGNTIETPPVIVMCGARDMPASHSTVPETVREQPPLCFKGIRDPTR